MYISRNTNLFMKWNMPITFINFTKLSQMKVIITISVNKRGGYENRRESY